MTLTNLPTDPNLDLANWVGQRSATFTFNLLNGNTGEHLGEINPIRNSAQLTHTTGSTIKRQLSLQLGVEDTAKIDPITSRIDVAMVVNGTSYPLGRYMVADLGQEIFTSGDLSSTQWTDEMFVLDQEITVGINSTGISIPLVLRDILDDFSFDFSIANSPFVGNQSWTVGSGRGPILEALALSGDYFSPWFSNNRVITFIRSFDPATQVPDFDWDSGNQVLRAGIVQTSDLVTAPNRFVVISNNSSDPNNVIFATADVPSTAPHSIFNRGFVVPKTFTLPVATTSQAQAVANNLVQRQTIFEQVTISTAPDPRHDSYNVIKWKGSLWLELSWSMSLVEGAAMTHTLRKSYLS